MKMKLKIAVLLTAAVFFLTGASVWEGSATVVPSGDLPGGGYSAATNSFPRNSIIDITNLENGKTVRVIVVSDLRTTGLLATLSRNAAEVIGLGADSVCRIRMTQPPDDIAFSRYRQGPLPAAELSAPLVPPAPAATRAPAASPASAASSAPAATLAPAASSAPAASPAPAATRAPATSSAPAATRAPAVSPTPATSPAEGSAVTDNPAVNPQSAEVEIPESRLFSLGAQSPDESLTAQTRQSLPPVVLSPTVPGILSTSILSAGTQTVMANEPPASPAVTETATPEPVAETFDGDDDSRQSVLTLDASEERVPVTEQPGIDPAHIIDPIAATGAGNGAWLEDEGYVEAPAEIVIVIDAAPAEYQPPLAGGSGWYVQIGAYSQTELVENEIGRIGIAYPITVQNAGTDIDPMFRLLLGPLNQGEGGAMLQRFKSIGYADAFMRRY